MPLLTYEGVGIAAIYAAVPRHKINNYEYTHHFPADEVKDVVNKIGVFERRFADKDTCASDLCFAAAEKLLTENDINKSEIDLLVFISQTPDYRMPATAIILQDRLGLSTGTMAFDINLGCSGFIYGLSVVYALMQQPGIRKALVLDGETRSKVYSPKDRRTAFLFGDAGAAALIEKNEKYGKSFFSLNSDGSREDLIKIPGGGYRNPSSSDTLRERVVDEYGNVRNDEQGYMNGGDVFNFVIREIPRDIQALIKYAQIEKNEIDYFILHQANHFINTYLAKKMHLDILKTPSNIEKFGNTSSVSIPLTMVTELKNSNASPIKALLSGFGVGMTWASGIICLDHCILGELVEV